MQITKQQLEKANACYSALVVFDRCFPNGSADVTVENVKAFIMERIPHAPEHRHGLIVNNAENCLQWYLYRFYDYYWTCAAYGNHLRNIEMHITVEQIASIDYHAECIARAFCLTVAEEEQKKKNEDSGAGTEVVESYVSKRRWPTNRVIPGQGKKNADNH